MQAMNMYKKVHSPMSGRDDRPCVAVCEVYSHLSTSSEVQLQLSHEYINDRTTH